MDNITHTLIGVTLAKALPPRSRDAAHAAVWTSVIASNLPDLDFIQSLGEGGGKIAYLLYHRGHTHTVWFTVVGAVITAFAGAKLGKLHPSRWTELFALAWAGCLLHIGADYWNNYGVHPFAPLFNSWFYGDAIFIVEPLLWFSLLPLVYLTAFRRASRIATGILGAGMLGMLWLGPFMSWELAAGITAWAVVVGASQYLIRGARVAVTASLLVLCVFVIQSWRAKRLVESELESQVPLETVRQLAVTPAPGNPWCWDVLAVGQILDERYTARTGTVSLDSRLFDPRNCFPRLRERGRGSAPLTAPSLRGRPGVLWAGEFRGSLTVARGMLARSCAFRQFLGFARVPYWSEKDPRAVGDMRYDFEPELGFAELDPEDSGACLERTPSWNPPTPLRAPFF